MSPHNFCRLEWAIADIVEDEPLSITTAPARAYPEAPIAGLIVTEIFAHEPGNGVGSRVLRQIIDVCHDVGVGVYLYPACDNSKRFYERLGFERLKQPRFGQIMASLPPLPDSIAA